MNRRSKLRHAAKQRARVAAARNRATRSPITGIAFGNDDAIRLSYCTGNGVGN